MNDTLKIFVGAKPEYVATKLRELIARKGLSKKELAASAGIHPTVLSRYIRTRDPQKPSTDTFMRILQILEVEPEAFLLGHEESQIAKVKDREDSQENATGVNREADEENLELTDEEWELISVIRSKRNPELRRFIIKLIEGADVQPKPEREAK